MEIGKQFNIESLRNPDEEDMEGTFEEFKDVKDTPCPKKKAFVFVSLLSASNLAQNSCPGTVLKSAGTQLSNAPPEI